MKITPLHDALVGNPMGDAHFAGPATGHPLHEQTSPLPVRVGVVRFEAGTKNHWHRHEGGQLLHVVEGEGYVQSRGEAPVRITAGDSVSAAPGEEHWHGAGPDEPMAHIAVSIGETYWGEPAE